jgi:hypothetical protein
MNKVNLEIVGLTYSESSTGAYVLILGDKLSQRRLPIVIGSAEAESIAVGIEKHRNGRPHTHDLFLRFAKEFGIEKLILKQNRMVCHLVSNQQSPFYQSGNFTKLIQYVQAYPRRATLKETPERLSLSIANVKTIATALEQLRLLTA